MGRSSSGREILAKSQFHHFLDTGSSNQRRSFSSLVTRGITLILRPWNSERLDYPMVTWPPICASWSRRCASSRRTSRVHSRCVGVPKTLFVCPLSYAERTRTHGRPMHSRRTRSRLTQVTSSSQLQPVPTVTPASSSQLQP